MISVLTARQVEIFRLVFAGYTNEVIALEVFISEETVKFYLDNIHKKIDMSTRLMARGWAMQQGMGAGQAKEIAG